MLVQEVKQLDNLPYPVGLQRIVCCGNDGLYLIGGATYAGSADRPSSSQGNDIHKAQMYKFNLSTQRWTPMKPVRPVFDERRAESLHVKHAARTSDDVVLVSRCVTMLDARNLMIAGGQLLDMNFNAASDSTYVYDLQTQTTVELKSPAVPSSDAGEQRAAADDVGLPGDYNDFFDQSLINWNGSHILCTRVIDSRTGLRKLLFRRLTLLTVPEKDEEEGLVKWETLPCENEKESRDASPASEAGNLCELAVHDDYVYCVDKNSFEDCLDVQRRFNLRTCKWEYVETTPDVSAVSKMCPRGKPVDRLFSACVSYGDYVYVVGGSAMAWAASRSNPVLADIWRLHLPTLRWSLAPSRLPEGLWFHSVDVSPSGCMYVFGGFTDVAGRKPTRKLWQVWLKEPPSLSSTAWRIVLKASDYRLQEKSDEELRDLRIPPCFVATLRW